MNMKEKEAALRKRLGLDDTVVIPAHCVELLPLEVVPLTGKDLEWALGVAKRYERYREPCDECSGQRYPTEEHEDHCSLNPKNSV